MGMDEQATVDCGGSLAGSLGITPHNLWLQWLQWTVGGSLVSTDYSTQPVADGSCDSQVRSQGIPGVWSYGH